MPFSCFNGKDDRISTKRRYDSQIQLMNLESINQYDILHHFCFYQQTDRFERVTYSKKLFASPQLSIASEEPQIIFNALYDTPPN